MGNSKADAFAMNWSDAEINLRQEVLADILAKRQAKVNGGSSAVATTENVSKSVTSNKSDKTIESKINAPSRPISKYEASKNDASKPASRPPSGINKPVGLVKSTASSSQVKLGQVASSPSKPIASQPVDKPVSQLVSPPPRSIADSSSKRVIPPPPPQLNKPISSSSPAKNVPVPSKPAVSSSPIVKNSVF